LPDVSGDRPSYDFLNAISQVTPSFSDQWDLKLAQGESVEFHNLVQVYRNFRRTTQTRPTFNPSRSAFVQSPTIEVAGPQPQASEKKLWLLRYPCFCSERHNWQECPYVNPAVRTKKWKPKDDIMKEFEKRYYKTSSL